MWVALLGIGLGLSGAAQVNVSVLDIAPGVSRLGAGGAGLAVSGGAETLYYNPAGLAALPGISFSSFYASHFGLANYSAFALAFRNWGLATMLLDVGGIPGYDGDGNPTDTLAYKNTALLFGFGFDPRRLPFFPRIAFDLAIGGTIKYLSARVGEAAGSGFSFDLGGRTTLPDLRLGPIGLSDVSFGVTLVNLFGAINYDTAREGFGMDIRVGGAARIARVILAAADVHLAGALHAGIAYQPVPALALRLGVISKGEWSLTAGAGIDIEGFVIDYAFVSHSLGGTHRVSLTVDFSGLDITAITRSLRRILP